MPGPGDLPLLPLAFIGWAYAIVCLGALALGAWIIASLHLQGGEAREHLARSVLSDTLLLGIWTMGLAGAIGVIAGAGWGRVMLEFFCWVMAVMVLATAWQRWHADTAARGPTLALSLVLWVVPAVVLLGATLWRLRQPG